MSFGWMNTLGQFVRESEPDPEGKKSRGMFTAAMRKWVQGSTEAAREEMAWKIAQMIVSEIVRQAVATAALRQLQLPTGRQHKCRREKPPS